MVEDSSYKRNMKFPYYTSSTESNGYEPLDTVPFWIRHGIWSNQSCLKRQCKIIAICGLSVPLLLFLHLTTVGEQAYEPLQSTSGQLNGSLNLDILKLHGISRFIQYSRCDIVATRTKVDSSPRENLEVSLPQFHTVDLYEDRYLDPSSVTVPPPLVVQTVKSGSKVDASHIIFGVATTLERLDESLGTFAHWASRSKARIYAIVEPQNPTAMESVQTEAKIFGVKLEISQSQDEVTDRYFALVKLLYQKGQETGAEWAAIIDDDTFFFSLSKLIARLDIYNSSLSQYVGAMSEDIEQMSQYGIMAYGGAGVFISMPLLKQLNEVFEECRQLPEGTGDKKLAHCIYKYTETKLTVEHQLHQVDLHGDPSGFYESGRPPPLSVHHWKSWSSVDMEKLATVAAVCGDTCLLRRWRFADGWFLNNGFSLVKYSSDLPEGDRTMEKTWDDQNGASDISYFHSLSPLRPKDEGKISYRLQDVIIKHGRVRQFYVHKSASGDADRVVELIWRQG